MTAPIEPTLSTATLRHTPLAILTTRPPTPATATANDKNSPASPPLRFLIHPPDAPAATAYTLPPNGVLATKYIVSDLASGMPRYWWTHKAARGIRVMRAPPDLVDSAAELHAEDLERMCQISLVDKANVVCAIRPDGARGMFSSKWVVEGGVEGGAAVAVKYTCKDRLTDGCRMVFTTKSAGAAYPEVSVVMYLKNGLMTVQAVSRDADAEGKVVVAAWVRRDGEMRVAGGVDVEAVIGMFAHAHRWLKKEFFVWEHVLVRTAVHY